MCPCYTYFPMQLFCLDKYMYDYVIVLYVVRVIPKSGV